MNDTFSLQELLDGGIINKLTETTLINLYGIQFMQQVKNPIDVTPAVQPLKITHLQGAFIIMAIGYTLALICLIAEGINAKL